MPSYFGIKLRMPILILAIPILEVMLLYQAAIAYGFLNLVFFLIMKGMIGKLIMRRASSIGNQQRPEHLISAMGNGFAGLLISLPVLLTSAVGVLLLLPPTRWILMKLFQKLFARMSQAGNFKVFTSQNFGQNFNGFANRPFVDPNENLSGERDVTPQIIDVRPIPIKDKKDSE